MSSLCITIRWLDDRYHGQTADGEPEWPPSPLRLFQAMVAGICRRADHAEAFKALQWIETLPPPHIIAPNSQRGRFFTRFVPNNDSDRKFERQERLTAKRVCPTLLIGAALIHYLWQLASPLSDADTAHVEHLAKIARSIVALGWGVDMAVGDAAIISDEQAKVLLGERWLPSERAAGGSLRVPERGTLNDVVGCHKRFLSRLGRTVYDAPPPLSTYREVVYRRATDHPSRSVAAFYLLQLDASRLRAFDAPRRALTVAGMMRGATKAAATRSGWPDAAFILGHGGSKDGGEHVAVGPRRFAYLPLPSIEGRGEGAARVAGSVRRVALFSFADDCDDEIAWARRALSGQELIDEDKKEPVALLSLIPSNEKVVRCYTQAAAQWATVTPVVLPGYDDPKHYRRRMTRAIDAKEQKELLERLDSRIDGLLRKAITQAGFSEVLASHAQLEWRKGGFWPGTELADRYGVPDHLKRFPLYHVKVEWRDARGKAVEVPGPICFGGGRFYGLGLFAAV